jgi:hypothetical protein
MTDVAAHPGGVGRVSASVASHHLWPTLRVTLVALLVIASPNLIDPMIRFDDYPALFADPAGYWHKTKDEGRWLGYLWHLRDVTTPAWLNHALYQLCWATIAASLGALTFRGHENAGWFAAVAALLVLVSPSALLISLWFNTLLPGIAIVAVYAVLAHFTSAMTLRALMPVFVILSFMSYTNYPLLILAIAALRTEDRSIRDLALLLAFFVVSFAAAVLTVYAINYQVHGVFGVHVADWRNATPASDLAGIVENFPILAETVRDYVTKITFQFEPAIYFHLGLLLGSTVILVRRVPLEAAYLFAVMAVGVAILLLQVLKMGLFVPTRACLIIWLIYALIVARATHLVSLDRRFVGRMARNCALLIIGSYGLQSIIHYSAYWDWQEDTRVLAADLQTVEGRVVVADDVLPLASAQKAFILDTRGLAWRLKQLTGRDVAVCLDGSGCCAAADAGGAVVCPTRIHLKPSETGPVLKIRPPV